MSFIIHIDNETALRQGLKRKHVWNINQPKPKFPMVDADDDIIVILQADGDELGLITLRFYNVPYTPGICIWRGEMAQFIYDNL